MKSATLLVLLVLLTAMALPAAPQCSGALIADNANAAPSETGDAPDQAPSQTPPEGANATITITAANSDGPARADVELYSVKPDDNKPALFTTRPLVQGKATIEVPPGKYNAVIIPAEEIVKQPKTINDVSVAAGDSVTRDVYFARGKISVAAIEAGGGKVPGVIALDNYDRESSRYTPLPASVLVVDGQAAFYLPPGNYRLRFAADGIIGAKEQSADIAVEDKAVIDYKPVVEYGLLKTACAAGGAPLKSHITIWREDAGGNGAAQTPAFSRDFDGAPLALKAAPGKYRVTVDADRAALMGAAQKVFDNVEISPGKENEISAVFEKGRAALTVRAFDGAAGRVDFQQWLDARQNYATFDTAQLKDGLNEFYLAPGKYRIVVVDTRVTPEAEYLWPDIEIADKSDLSHSIYVERGRVSMVAVNNGKPAEGEVTLEMKDGDEEKRIGGVALENGRASVELRPGTYRLTYQRSPERAQGISTDWFEVKERAWLTRVFDAGAAGQNAPPEVDLWGPYEVGDEDAVLEAGERMTFSTRFGGETFAGARITLSMPGEDGKIAEKELAQIAKPGLDKDREVALERPGEYTLRIVAWDSGEQKMETVVERKFTVRPRHEDRQP
jgi:hypothetical protein